MDLLVEALHGQKACLRLLGALFGGLGSGEGLAIQVSEMGLGPYEARHEEVKEGPQLQHIVLDGCACQDEAVLRYYSLACLQPLGFISGGAGEKGRLSSLRRVLKESTQEVCQERGKERKFAQLGVITGASRPRGSSPKTTAQWGG